MSLSYNNGATENITFQTTFLWCDSEPKIKVQVDYSNAEN